VVRDRRLLLLDDDHLQALAHPEIINPEVVDVYNSVQGKKDQTKGKKQEII